MIETLFFFSFLPLNGIQPLDYFHRQFSIPLGVICLVCFFCFRSHIVIRLIVMPSHFVNNALFRDSSSLALRYGNRALWVMTLQQVNPRKSNEGLPYPCRVAAAEFLCILFRGCWIQSASSSMIDTMIFMKRLASIVSG